jgi:hypothetical protein
MSTEKLSKDLQETGKNMAAAAEKMLDDVPKSTLLKTAAVASAALLFPVLTGAVALGGIAAYVYKTSKEKKE